MVAAIAQSNGSRSDVAKQLFKIKLKNSILGNVSFNANGDVTANPVTIYKVKGGKSTDPQGHRSAEVAGEGRLAGTPAPPERDRSGGGEHELSPSSLPMLRYVAGRGAEPRARTGRPVRAPARAVHQGAERSGRAAAQGTSGRCRRDGARVEEAEHGGMGCKPARTRPRRSRSTACSRRPTGCETPSSAPSAARRAPTRSVMPRPPSVRPYARCSPRLEASSALAPRHRCSNGCRRRCVQRRSTTTRARSCNAAG